MTDASDDLPTGPSRSRLESIKRLADELESAAQLLDDCEPLARDVKMARRFTFRTLGWGADQLRSIGGEIHEKHPEIGVAIQGKGADYKLETLRRHLEQALRYVEDSAYLVADLNLERELNLPRLQEILARIKPLHDGVAEALGDPNGDALRDAWRRIAKLAGDDPPADWVLARERGLELLHTALDLARQRIVDCTNRGDDDLISEAGLKRSDVIRGVAYALSTISDVQNSIYHHRADLMPFWLTKDYASPHFVVDPTEDSPMEP